MFQLHDERLFTLPETPLRLPMYVATGIMDKISGIPVSSAGGSNFEDETSSLPLAPLLNSNAARISNEYDVAYQKHHENPRRCIVSKLTACELMSY